MRKELLYCLSFGLLAFGMSIHSFAQIKHTVKFSEWLVRLGEKTGGNGETYSTVEYFGFNTGRQEGAPALPYKYLQFIVPDGPAAYRVEAVSTSDRVFYLPNRLWPIQTPIMASISETSNPFVVPDPSIYNSVLPYPAQTAEIVSDGYFDGNKRIITVKVSPMQYLPTDLNKMVFHRGLSLSITPDATHEESVSSIKAIHSSVSKSDEELMEELKFVENKDDILTYARQQDHSSSSGIELNLPAYEYTIIAPAAYVPALERLVFWKKMKGMTAGVVTLESILYHPDIKGDEVSKIYDDAGKVRHYLTYAYQQGAKYVFLVGKDVPFRYGCFREKIPTDLYYSDLNGNWNSSHSKDYGTISDNIDCLPELYVGRITCKNVTELNNYLYKLICYEKNPGYGNGEYLKKAFYTQADGFQHSQLGTNFANKMSTYFPDPLIFEEMPSYDDPDPYFPTGKEVVDEMNKHYGFVGFFNHGDDYGISLSTVNNADTTKCGLSIIDKYEATFKVIEKGNGVDCLTNQGYPSVVYTLSCCTMPYDKKSDIPYNFGEAFTIMGKYGAVAYLGSTRDLFLSSDIETHFATELKNSEKRIGATLAKAKTKFSGKTYWDIQLSYNLLGCPEFQMWTDKPKEFINIGIENQNNSIAISSGEENSSVNILGLFSGESYKKQQFIDTSSTLFFDNIPKNYIISVDKENYRPYIAPLYLQNEIITGKYNLFDMNKVYIGNYVDSNKKRGDFILKNNSEVCIEYSDEVVLDYGFEVEEGAVFELKPTEK